MILIFIELHENAKKRGEGLLLLENESKQSIYNILDSHFAGRPVFLCSNNFHFNDIYVRSASSGSIRFVTDIHDK